jgi:phosphoribosylanthranilate isomerase
VPVFLAGGLRPDNAAAAIAAVLPWGLDVCSGVRTEGALDAARLADFMRAVAAA